MTLHCMVMFYVFSCTTATPAPAAKNPPSDLDQLQGEWKLIGAAEKGIVIVGKDIDDENELGIRIKGKTITFLFHKTSPMTFHFDLDSKKQPKHINFRYQYNKGINHAIYWRWKNIILIASSRKMRPNSAKDRPRDFSPVPVSKNQPLDIDISIYKRV